MKRFACNATVGVFKLVKSVFLQRFVAFTLSTSLALGLGLYLFCLIVYDGPDNRGCSVHYVDLERTWLRESAANIKKTKNLDDHHVLAYVDDICTLERLFKKIQAGEDVSLQAYRTAQKDFDQSFEKLCPLVKWQCLLYPPEPEELANWLELMTSEPVEPVFHFRSGELNRLVDLITPKRTFIIRAIVKTERVLVYFQTPSQTHSKLINGYTESYSETFTILRICAACSTQAYWADCPAKYTIHSIRKENSSSGYILNEHGLIVYTWLQSTYYPESSSY